MSISKTANDESAQKDAEPAMDTPDAEIVPNGADNPTKTTVGQEFPKQQEETRESSLAEADVPKKRLCGVCNEKEWKYKCTRCYFPS